MSTPTKIETGCGRFSAQECRALLGDNVVDMRSLGCPESIMSKVLEARSKSRTAFLAAHPNAKPEEWRSALFSQPKRRTAPKPLSEREQLLRAFQAVGTEIAAEHNQEVSDWFNAPPKPKYGPGGLGF